MTDDLSKVGQQTADDITKTLIVEVVKKVSIEHGDILVVNVANEDVLNQFYTVLNEIHKPKKFIIVDQSQIDLLREVDEDEMRELGWERIDSNVALE